MIGNNRYGNFYTCTYLLLTQPMKEKRKGGESSRVEEEEEEEVRDKNDDDEGRPPLVRDAAKTLAGAVHQVVLALRQLYLCASYQVNSIVRTGQ